MPKRTLLAAAAAGLAATTFVAPPGTVSAFVPTQGVSTRKRSLPTTTSTTGLNAIAPPPMPSPFREEEKSDKDKKKGDDDSGGDDWTETSGGGVRGFVPTFLRTNTKNEAEAPTKTKKRSPRDLIANVETLEDYKIVVADETEKITVVRFYAKWCRSCRASEPHFHKLIHDFADPHGVKFVQVPLKKENAFLHEGLGVPSVPFAHIYHPEGGLVEEMKMNKKKFSKIRTSLEQYVAGSCYLEDEPEEEDMTDDIDDGTPIGEFQ